MSVAMASILRVFFMPKTERKVYSVNQRGEKRWKQRKKQKRVKGRVNSGKKWEHWNELERCVRSYMCVRWQYTTLSRSAVSISKIASRKISPARGDLL
jgi:hypothetical protein